MDSRRSRWVRVVPIFVGLTALIAVWVVVSRSQHGPSPLGSAAPDAASPSPMLQMVPAGALLVVTIDVDQLRRTEFGAELLSHRREIPGLGLVPEVCGADPMDAMAELAVAVPAAGLDTDFGVFATGRFDAEQLLSCAQRIVSRRGGRPVVRTLGGFRVLHDSSLGPGSAELAVASGGRLVLAQGDYLRSSLAAADGKTPSVAGDVTHAGLRQSVGSGLVVATVVLTPAQRQGLAQELAQQGQADSPFASVAAGALSIQLRTTPVAAVLQARAVLTCEPAATCATLAPIVERARADRVGGHLFASPALGAALAAVDISVEDSQLHLRMDIPVRTAIRILQEVLSRPPWAQPRPRAPSTAAPPGSAAATARARLDAGVPPR